MLTRLRPRPADDDGLVAVSVALVVVLVVMPLLALVIDLGLTRTADGQARAASDAAALAAAAEHPGANDSERAVAAAHRLAAANFGVTEDDWAGCVDEHPLPAVSAPGNCVSFDFTAKQVRVRVPARRVPSVFAGVIGAAAPAASATSTATWGAFAGPCVLCVLGSYSGGAQRLEVGGGDVAVGGGLTLDAGGTLVTDPGRTVSVGGTAPGNLGTTRGVTPVDPFAAQLADLARLAASTSAGSLPAPLGASAGVPCTPGTYQDVSDCQAFTPGVYVLFGNGLPAPYRSTITLKGSGTGVVFYVTCSTPWWVSYPPRSAPCSGGTTLQPRINPPTSGSATLGGHVGYGSLVLAFDPSSPAGTNTNTNQRFAGGGTLTLNGSIDGPGLALRNPSPARTGRVVIAGGRVVVGKVGYDDVVPVPTHAYLTVQAPVSAPLPDGPVRLVATTG